MVVGPYNAPFGYSDDQKVHDTLSISIIFLSIIVLDNGKEKKKKGYLSLISRYPWTWLEIVMR